MTGSKMYPPPPFPAENLARLKEEYLQAAARAWSTLRLDEAEAAPKPVQSGLVHPVISLLEGGPYDH